VGGVELTTPLPLPHAIGGEFSNQGRENNLTTGSRSSKKFENSLMKRKACGLLFGHQIIGCVQDVSWVIQKSFNIVKTYFLFKIFCCV
jgi:hypothetical protein